MRAMSSRHDDDTTGDQAASPDHHLWRNRSTWWTAFTVVVDGYRQERVRRSLGTRDLATARARRDAMMREYAARPHVQLSLRPAARRAGRPVMTPGGC